MNILVTGATGVVGRELVSHLLQSGVQVRAVTRNPTNAQLPAGADIIHGSASDPARLNGAFYGIDAIYVTPRSSAGALADLLRLARQANVRRVVLISALTVAYGGGEQRFIEQFRAAENAVAASGIQSTVLRCADFAANAKMWVPQLHSSDIVRGAYGHAATACIHQRDIAEIAALALCNDGHVGATYELTGPARISQIEKVRIIGAESGRDLVWQETPGETIRENMIAAGMPEEIPARLLGYLKYAAESETPLTDTVPRLLNRDARSFTQWVRDYWQ